MGIKVVSICLLLTHMYMKQIKESLKLLNYLIFFSILTLIWLITIFETSINYIHVLDTIFQRVVCT